MNRNIRPKSLSINLSMWILLITILQVVLTDNIIYFLKTDYIVANILALIANTFINIILLNRKIQLENHYCKWDILFLALLFFICVISIGFADNKYDTYSYHIYLQENPFNDKIYDDFFPGRTLTSYVYPLVDRLFYMFRYAAGFRLGTLPSYLVLIPMFYGVKKILKYFIPDISNTFLSICAIFPLCTFIILEQTGTYYIDNFSVVILLEFVYAVITYCAKTPEDKPKIYYLAILSGLAVCIKFTNLIFLPGPLLYFFIVTSLPAFRAISLKWHDYILLLIVFFVPMLPYFTNTVIQTGNPVFPYYNKLFRSEYFSAENWLDLRFGPKNLLQFIFWPIYILFHPGKAYDLTYGATDFAYALGYIISIYYVVKGTYGFITKSEKTAKNKLFYAIILLYFYLMWQKFALGYTRYGGIIPILSMIFLIWLLWEGLARKKKIRKLLCMAVIVFCTAITGSNYCRFCCPRYYLCHFIPGMSRFIREENASIKVLHAFTMFGKDRDNISYNIDGIWGVIGDDSMVPQLLSTDDQIVHLEYGVKTGTSPENETLYWDNILQNQIYVPLYEEHLSTKLSCLDEFHFELTELTDILYDAAFLQGEQVIYIVQVRYNSAHSSGNHEIFQSMKEQLEVP